MLLPVLPPFRPRRGRPRPTGSIPPGPAPVTVTGVYQGGEGSYRFFWVFDATFDDTPAGGGSWTLDDFLNLTVSSQPPTAIDEIIGGDKLVALVYDNLQDPDEVTLWELVGPVPQLLFEGGRPLNVQSGTIQR